MCVCVCGCCISLSGCISVGEVPWGFAGCTSMGEFPRGFAVTSVVGESVMTGTSQHVQGYVGYVHVVSS